jgi:hypothetical protein
MMHNRPKRSQVPNDTTKAVRRPGDHRCANPQTVAVASLVDLMSDGLLVMPTQKIVCGGVQVDERDRSGLMSVPSP